MKPIGAANMASHEAELTFEAALLERNTSRERTFKFVAGADEG